MNDAKHPVAAVQAIETLQQKMAEIEASRENRLKDGMSDADASLVAGCEALSAVSEMLLGQSIEARPINRVLVDLSAISLEAQPSDMLAFRGGKGRPPENPMVEEVKGHLAAIAEYRQNDGLTRIEAAEWVVRHLSKPMKTALRNPAPKTIDSWLVKFGGANAARGRGRRGYVVMRKNLGEKPDDQFLIKWIHHLVRYLPPRAESD